MKPYDSLRRYEPFKRLFADRMQEHLFGKGVLAEANSQARIDAFIDQLELPMIAESARWGNIHGGVPLRRNVEWESEVAWVRDVFIARRADTVEAALVGACDGDLTVGQILDALAGLLERDPADLRGTYLPVVRELLVEGFLTPAR